VIRAPFVVLHVCMGNICRSPMAERLLAHALRVRLGDRAAEFIHTESAGTGGWHVGESMNPPAAKELRRRGASESGFRVRKLLGAHIDSADLILTATAEQLRYVTGLRPDARARAFVLGEFGRLLDAGTVRAGDAAGERRGVLGAPGLRVEAVTPAGVHARGVALVAAVNAARADADPLPGDDLDDPWGRADAYFGEIADEIEATIGPLVDALVGTAVG
jgi:protein-tyrosine phosphatase